MRRLLSIVALAPIALSSMGTVLAHDESNRGNRGNNGNNTDTAGRQDVAFCYDPENNGCYDARIVSYISIDWVA